MAERKPTQSDLILGYYQRNSKRDIPHAEIVDWVTQAWLEQTGLVLRDPDRAIRKLHEEGLLIKVKKGLYRYDPDSVEVRQLEDFSALQKKAILERDGYKCVVCGRGVADGVELQVDHIKPKYKGGEATIENGQTLCAQHNFRKKNYSQTESGKKMFINLLKLAKKSGDAEMVAFCEDILRTYEKHDINGHIEWSN